MKIFWKVFSLFIVSTLFTFGACSGDSGNNSGSGGGNQSEYFAGAKVVSSIDDLPACNDNTDGQLFYILSPGSAEGQFQYCDSASGSYIVINLIGSTGPAGPAGPAGDDGDDGSNGLPGPAGSSCSITDNLDGTKTIDCEDGTSVTVYDGEDGIQGLPGLPGADGGSCTVADNGNNTYTISCDDGTSIVISDGITGDTGADGADGLNSLIVTSPESAGLNCIDDGTKIDVGIDDDSDGILDPDEVDSTAYICTLGVATGANKSYDIDELTFNMKYVPRGLTFPAGILDDGTADVDNSYFIAETETTFELWSTVYIWATGDADMNGTIDPEETAGSYTISNAGRMGSDAGGTGMTALHPVTIVSWRDAMVWTNALTEYYNANNGSDPDLDPVYYADTEYITPIRSTADPQVDEPYIKALSPGNTEMVNCIAKGFRLATGNEWELAARYIGTTAPSTGGNLDDDVVTTEVDGTTYYWTPGDYASGATAVYTDATATDLVAWYGYGSSGSTYPVKGKSPNALGIYDMSGNVWEWNFDLYGTPQRLEKGGGWWDGSSFLRVGLAFDNPPDYEDISHGFRFTRTYKTPPLAVTSSPADGAVGAALDSDIVITFSESMITDNEWNVTCDNITYGASDTGNVNWTVDNTVLTINPSDDLTGGTFISVILAEFTAEADGAELSGTKTIQFFAGMALPPGAAPIIASDTALSLKWSPVTGADAYEVWYHTADDSASAIQSGGDIAGTNHVITGLSNDTLYYVWLKFRNSAGTCDFGPVASGTPRIITFENATVPGEAVTVTVNEMDATWSMQTIPQRTLFSLWD